MGLHSARFTILQGRCLLFSTRNGWWVLLHLFFVIYIYISPIFQFIPNHSFNLTTSQAMQSLWKHSGFPTWSHVWKSQQLCAYCNIIYIFLFRIIFKLNNKQTLTANLGSQKMLDFSHDMSNRSSSSYLQSRTNGLLIRIFYKNYSSLK